MSKPDYEVTKDHFIDRNWMIWDGESPLGGSYATEAEALTEMKRLQRRDRFWRWVLITTLVPFMLYYFWHNNPWFGDWPPLPQDMVEGPDNGYDLD